MSVCVSECIIQSYFKELAHVIVGARSPKPASRPAGCRSRGEVMLPLESQGSLEEEFFPPLGPQSFLLMPSTD